MGDDTEVITVDVYTHHNPIRQESSSIFLPASAILTMAITPHTMLFVIGVLLCNAGSLYGVIVGKRLTQLRWSKATGIISSIDVSYDECGFWHSPRVSCWVYVAEFGVLDPQRQQTQVFQHKFSSDDYRDEGSEVAILFNPKNPSVNALDGKNVPIFRLSCGFLVLQGLFFVLAGAECLLLSLYLPQSEDEDSFDSDFDLDL